VSSPPRLNDAGLALRLNTRTLSRPSSFFSGKWTFLERKGVVGADRTRRCMGRTSSGIDDSEGDLDFREDLRGFPLAKRMGCEEPRASGGRSSGEDGEDGVSSGVPSPEGDSGEDTGKGTVSLSLGGEYRPLGIARSLRDGGRHFVSMDNLANC
jgi:hypothetical protein